MVQPLVEWHPVSQKAVLDFPLQELLKAEL